MKGKLWHLVVFCTSDPQSLLINFIFKSTGCFKTKSIIWHFDHLGCASGLVKESPVERKLFGSRYNLQYIAAVKQRTGVSVRVVVDKKRMWRFILISFHIYLLGKTCVEKVRSFIIILGSKILLKIRWLRFCVLFFYFYSLWDTFLLGRSNTESFNFVLRGFQYSV